MDYNFNNARKSKISGATKSERKYDFVGIEKKWHKKWEEKKIFNVKESNAREQVSGATKLRTTPMRRTEKDFVGKKKYYILDMFPYPSGEGLHMGHAFVFSLGDCLYLPLLILHKLRGLVKRVSQGTNSPSASWRRGS